MPVIYQSKLSSAVFDFNCCEGDPNALANLFEGMSVPTARNVLAHPHLLNRPTISSIEVPDYLIDAEPATAGA